jgi:hypothetical protein
MWDKILLDRNFQKAQTQIDTYMAFWNKKMIFKVKKRLAYIHLYLKRMRKIRRSVR